MRGVPIRSQHQLADTAGDEENHDPPGHDARRQCKREPATPVHQPSRRFAQQSDALCRRDHPGASEENGERAERDLAGPQPPELTKTRNSSNRKQGQSRNAAADREFGEKARCAISR